MNTTAEIKGIRLRLYGGINSVFSTAIRVAKQYDCPVQFSCEGVKHSVNKHTAWTDFWKRHQDSITNKHKAYNLSPFRKKGQPERLLRLINRDRTRIGCQL